MLAGFFNGNNSLPSIDESGELVINENDAKFVVNEDNLPSAIFGAIDIISSLEKKIRQSSDEANSVLDYINNNMKRYKNKSLFGFGYRSGNTKDIIEDLQKAVELDNKFIDAYYSMAVIYKNLGEYKLAITALDKILDIDEQSVNARALKKLLIKKYLN